jgi:hypothetical protein
MISAANHPQQLSGNRYYTNFANYTDYLVKYNSYNSIQLAS